MSTKNKQNKDLKIAAITIISFILFMFFIAYKAETMDDIYSAEIVAAKNIELKDGNTVYKLAFESGYIEDVNFYQYSQYEIGDTAWFKYIDDYWWELVSSNPN